MEEKELAINNTIYCLYYIDPRTPNVLFIRVIECFQMYTEATMKINLAFIVAAIEGLPQFTKLESF